MKSIDIKRAFWKIANDYDDIFCKSEYRKRYCPIKQINNLKYVDGASVERKTLMMGTTIKGHYGEKRIYVNDETNGYEEDVFIHMGTDFFSYHNQGITTFRCGIMTAVAVYEMLKKVMIVPRTWGFIGCGRTNIMNCRVANEIFGIEEAVIRGSDKNRAKNLDKFKEICNTTVDDTDDCRLIDSCDIVVVCTSNFSREHMYSTKDLKHPKILIVLDCGYTLDESFRRECVGYTDYIEQIESDYDDEFPFDSKPYPLKQMAENKDLEGGRVCVYLHGIGYSDVAIAELKAEGFIE